MIKNFFYILCILCLFISVGASSVKNNQSETQKDDNHEIDVQNIKEDEIETQKIDNHGIVIIEFQEDFEYLYFSKNPPSLDELGDLHGYKYIMNASFFDGWTGEAEHAGWLKISGKLHSSIKEDRQLTHVAVLDSESQLKFYDYHSFKSSNDKNTIEFQTGPLILDKNRITHDYINSSINGNEESERALLGFTEDGNKYFIVTTKPVTLSVLAHELLKRSEFRGKKLSVVNLDGGPSVALYMRDNPAMNFNSQRKLPLLLIVK